MIQTEIDRLEAVLAGHRCKSDKAWENYFVRKAREQGYTVLRLDHKNNLPDYIIKKPFSSAIPYFIELKNSIKGETPIQVIKRVRKKQPKQFENFEGLTVDGFNTYMGINSNGKVRLISGLMVQAMLDYDNEENLKEQIKKGKEVVNMLDVWYNS